MDRKNRTQHRRSQRFGAERLGIFCKIFLLDENLSNLLTENLSKENLGKNLIKSVKTVIHLQI